MANEKQDFLAGMIFIMLLIGIVLGFGHQVYQKNTTEEYFDFNKLDLLNNSYGDIEVVSNNPDYNSLVFSNISVPLDSYGNNTSKLIFNADFSDVNLSKASEIDLEYSFDFSNMSDNDKVDAMRFTFDKNDLSGMWTQLRVNGKSIELGDSSVTFFPRALLNNNVKIIYKIDLDDSYIIGEAENLNGSNRIIGFGTFQDVGFNGLKDNATTSFYFVKDMYNTTVTNSFKINYIKITVHNS